VCASVIYNRATYQLFAYILLIYTAVAAYPSRHPHPHLPFYIHLTIFSVVVVVVSFLKKENKIIKIGNM
jgi:hypothetical protein